MGLWQMAIARVTYKGKSIAQFWTAGVIPALLGLGLSLRDAQFVAEAEGHLVSMLVTENLVVDDGLELAIDMLLDADDAGVAYCEIGTGSTTPTSSDTDLVTGVSRKSWLTRERAGQTGDFSTFFLASESTYDIQEIGSFGGSGATITLGSGKMFSRWLQSYDNSGGNNDLTIDYSITAEAG